jgi:hypothetical protein
LVIFGDVYQRLDSLSDKQEVGSSILPITTKKEILKILNFLFKNIVFDMLVKWYNTCLAQHLFKIIEVVIAQVS